MRPVCRFVIDNLAELNVMTRENRDDAWKFMTANGFPKPKGRQSVWAEAFSVPLSEEEKKHLAEKFSALGVDSDTKLMSGFSSLYNFLKTANKDCIPRKRNGTIVSSEQELLQLINGHTSADRKSLGQWVQQKVHARRFRHPELDTPAVRKAIKELISRTPKKPASGNCGRGGKKIRWMSFNDEQICYFVEASGAKSRRELEIANERLYNHIRGKRRYLLEALYPEKHNKKKIFGFVELIQIMISNGATSKRFSVIRMLGPTASYYFREHFGYEIAPVGIAVLRKENMLDDDTFRTISAVSFSRVIKEMSILSIDDLKMKAHNLWELLNVMTHFDVSTGKPVKLLRHLFEDCIVPKPEIEERMTG